MTTYRTKTGKILTDEDVERLAEEAEVGYPVDVRWISGHYWVCLNGQTVRRATWDEVMNMAPTDG